MAPTMVRVPLAGLGKWMLSWLGKVRFCKVAKTKVKVTAKTNCLKLIPDPPLLSRDAASAFSVIFFLLSKQNFDLKSTFFNLKNFPEELSSTCLPFEGSVLRHQRVQDERRVLRRRRRLGQVRHPLLAGSSRGLQKFAGRNQGRFAGRKRKAENNRKVLR